MGNELWDFIDVRKVANSKSDKIFNRLTETIFDAMKSLLNIQYQQYNNFKQLIREQRNLNNSDSYFWDWFEKVGYQSLKQILETNLPDDEKLLKLLEYREMVLQLDIKTGYKESYFTSVADTFESIIEFIQPILGECCDSKR